MNLDLSRRVSNTNASFYQDILTAYSMGARKADYYDKINYVRDNNVYGLASITIDTNIKYTTMIVRLENRYTDNSNNSSSSNTLSTISYLVTIDEGSVFVQKIGEEHNYIRATRRPLYTYVQQLSGYIALPDLEHVCTNLFSIVSKNDDRLVFLMGTNDFYAFTSILNPPDASDIKSIYAAVFLLYTEETKSINEYLHINDDNINSTALAFYEGQSFAAHELFYDVFLKNAVDITPIKLTVKGIHHFANVPSLQINPNTPYVITVLNGILLKVDNCVNHVDLPIWLHSAYNIYKNSPTTLNLGDNVLTASPADKNTSISFIGGSNENVVRIYYENDPNNIVHYGYKMSVQSMPCIMRQGFAQSNRVVIYFIRHTAYVNQNYASYNNDFSHITFIRNYFAHCDYSTGHGSNGITLVYNFEYLPIHMFSYAFDILDFMIHLLFIYNSGTGSISVLLNYYTTEAYEVIVFK